MSADPEPKHAVRRVNGQSAMMRADTYRMEAPDVLEMQRRISRIGLQKLELLVR